jgi:nucleoside-diphosphate-sugar epimerase
MSDGSRSRVLVTGGAGFIGRRTARALLPAGAEVTSADLHAFPDSQVRSVVSVGTFLLASTNAVTGDVGRATITEQIPLRPLTPNGATKAAGEMLLGAGESVPVNDILAAARVVTGAELPAEHVPPKPGEMPAVIIDISVARGLGYQPEHDLKAGIATVWPEFSETYQ